MGAALVPLQTITLGSAAASVTFGSIPSTLRDLRIVMNGTLSSANQSIFVRFNGDTSGTYNYVLMYGGGAPATSASYLNQTRGEFGYMTSTTINAQSDVLDYSATDKHKPYVSRSNDATDLPIAYAGRWASNSAITSVQVYPTSANFATGTVISLYGVKA